MSHKATVSMVDIKVVFSKKDLMDGRTGLWPRVTLTDGTKVRTFSLRTFSYPVGSNSDTGGAALRTAVSLMMFRRAVPKPGTEDLLSRAAAPIWKRVMKALSDERLRNTTILKHNFRNSMRNVFFSREKSFASLKPSVVMKVWKELQDEEIVGAVHES